MLKDKPAAILRTDYRPPPFSIEQAELDFELEKAATRVKARLDVARAADPSAVGKPLRLDGEGLDLQRVRIDGRLLNPNEFQVDAESLTIASVPDKFVLETDVIIKPQDNTELSGLYVSNDVFCTQCEAEGFRRITYFLDRPDVMSRYRVRITADAAKFPVLLSNGNNVDNGTLADGRHWAEWEDPFPKPCYLFALVAGRLEHLEDRFTTRSGRNVTLRIYTREADVDKCGHAMESLKKAMTWDEQVFGLEYDLDVFNIVAVGDFNMGAMENKSLNIFNTSYILARPETATDGNFANVESVVAHEYFHNWTGNRVTCRDWFQLSLKEGLTVFRDQQFSADMGSRAVTRIADVRGLRSSQFAEDSSPMAHPVRPESYIEINNFYTATVYNKGAEVIRMMHRLLGADGFRKGMDLYFERHDGQAVTCDDFASAMEDASGVDLGQFRLWYSQAGTPQLKVSGHYDETAKSFELSVEQTVPDTPGQTNKKPMHIPFAVGLLDESGEDIPLKLEGENSAGDTTRVLDVTKEKQTFRFVDVPGKPVPSLLRDFSAPVRLKADLDDDALIFLMGHDSDPFNRWEAGQQLGVRLMLGLVERYRRQEKLSLEPGYVEALRKTLTDPSLDKAFIANVLSLPSEMYLGQNMEQIDVDAIHAVRTFVRAEIAHALKSEFEAAYRDNAVDEPYAFEPKAVGRRSLKNSALSYLVAGDPDGAGEGSPVAQCLAQFRAADNMTDEIGALGVLSHVDRPERVTAMEEFYDKWRNDALAVDKWFALQAMSERSGIIQDVKKLLDHPAYDGRNPNKVRALVGAFCFNNPAGFHDVSGEGYEFLASRVLALDPVNPQVAARLAGALGRWRKYDPARQDLMKAALERIVANPNLSKDVYEIVSKSLA